MKTLLPILTILLCSMSLVAQTTITNTTFFEVGDVLYTSTDNLPNISLGNAGANQNWDFSSLDAAQVDAQEIYPAANGAGNFPAADAYINALGGELYLDIQTNSIRQIGFVGTQFGMNINVPLIPSSNYRQAPINYQDEFTETYGIGLAVSADQLPFLDSLDLPITPDSIRISQVIVTEYNVDAWGTVQLPMGNFDALRMHRLQTTETVVEAYVGFPLNNWLDVTDLIVGVVDLPEFDATPVESYEFLADGVKEPLAVIQLEPLSGTVASVTFKSDPNSTSIAQAGLSPNTFAAHPNPAYMDVRIDISGFERGMYELGLFDLTGKKVLSKDLNIQRDTSTVIRVSQLPKGTYLYALMDSNGKVLKAKRLMVIKP